jgi:hypothetical protein
MSEEFIVSVYATAHSALLLLPSGQLFVVQHSPKAALYPMDILRAPDARRGREMCDAWEAWLLTMEAG